MQRCRPEQPQAALVERADQAHCCARGEQRRRGALEERRALENRAKRSVACQRACREAEEEEEEERTV